MTAHIGFTGTRHGMAIGQRATVDRIVRDLVNGAPFTAHHGLCVGADEGFHRLVRQMPLSHIVGHPGPDWPRGNLCARVDDCDEVLDPMSYTRRNRAIVTASQIMIAAPYEHDPWSRGGTWMTIRMARVAHRRGLLRELHVVGRDGQLLDHSRWP